MSRYEPVPAVSPEFVLEIVADAADIDELGHVSNIVYIRWVQDVAKAHSASVGWDHEAYKRLGAVFVVRRHEIDYLAPIYAGDRVLITTFLAGWSAATSDRRTEIVSAADGRALARARTVWALIGIAAGRPRRIPPEIMEAFSKPLTTP